MSTTKRTMETTDISLPGGRALRLALIRAHDGEPDEIRIAEGWTAPWREDHRRVLCLPGHVLSELRQALEALEQA